MNSEISGGDKMKWNEVREKYHNQWILIEALEADSKDGNRLIKDVSVINSYNDSKSALKEYAEKHKKNKSREMYVYHTKNQELVIKERTRIGVRKNG
ncbi:hypothetical protein [Oceanirhabdus sp. W0125-5]|uniref:hypothetical protein n=1 Tax=Oceanirhabdus sp. W0125-5 TaxID=2999116 RepID=UPI0022F2E59F|nr:hypothetical protein [Oceanirhabdus sp. W0125-5]WBW95203.1 hypothetical protein OW730_16080 [Oceanirhabdus sp. W0125-5]